jgi:hypothetical protein
MKKSFSYSFPRVSGWNKLFAKNSRESAPTTPARLLKLWHLSMAVLLGTILLGFSAPVMGQAVNATLLGTVTDSSGATVANAKVTITETNTGIGHTSQTNESGNYIFPDLPPGTYRVIAEQTGFKRESRAGIDLIVNSTERVDLVLQPGNMSETVTVEAETPILQTERADTGRKLETVLTENLPLGTNRNFQNLLNLVPGTTRAMFQHSQFFNASSSLQTEVNGQLREGNNYQIEGIDDNERTGLLQILIPPLEAIQTVDVSTSNYDAELGRASGAVTNVILKSGSNNFHGAAYEFFKSNYLNARNFFDKSVGHLAYNYFGGNIGGPIKKNKVFFFGDYLKIFDHEANTNTVNIPTMAIRTGDLSASTTAIYNPFSGNPDGTSRQQIVARSAPGVTVPGRSGPVDAFNPACTNPAGCPNIIPLAMIDAISTKLLAFLPAPTAAGNSNNYFALLPFHKDTDFVDAKIDANLTDRDRLSGRFSFQRPSVFQAPIFGLGGGPAQGNFEGSGIQNTYSVGLNYNRFFSNTLVAEFRAGVAWYHNEAHNTDFGTKTSATLGIPGVNLDPITSGIVGIQINGGVLSNPIIGFSPSLPWIRSETNIDFANTWTKIIGNHAVKFGVDLRRIRDALLQEQTFSPRGLYTFNDGQTALNIGNNAASKTSFYNNFASFLFDVPGQAGRDLATFFPNYRAWQFFSFVQDKWLVTPKLTADIGLRWEFYPPATPVKQGGFSNYDPTNNTLRVSGFGDIPDNLGITTHYKYFAPRLGLAYRLRESTVIRAGFGISFTPFPDNSYAYNFPVRSNNAFNPPIVPYSNFVPAVLADNVTPATFANGFPAIIQPVVPPDGVITSSSSPAAAVVLKNSNLFVVNQNFKNPYVESWNLAIQQSLPGKFVLDVAYVGNHSVDTVVNYNLNAGIIAGAGNSGLPESTTFGRTASTNLLFAGYSSSYHALQVKFDRKFTGGLATTTAYTFGKGMGFQTGDDGNLFFYINQSRNYARNDFDRTQTFVQSFVYDFPFGHGKRWVTSGPAAAVVGGWRVSTFMTIMSGLPMAFTAPGTSLAAPGNTQTPNLVAPVKILHGIGPNDPWFSTSSFAAPTASGAFGNVGRNYLSGPNFFDLDATLSKSIRFTERYNMELRLEAFGVTNTPQFFFTTNGGTANGTTYNPSPTSPFGHITSATGGRTLQLGAKFNF